MRLHWSRVIWMLLVAAVVSGQNRPKFKPISQPSSGLKTDCVGNVMRLTLDKALAVGHQLEVEAVNGTRHTLLMPSLAAQCGYSMESDPWGNTRIYTSLLGCYIDNHNDETFNVGLRLRMYSQNPLDEVTHDITKTCKYSQWASQEILCDRNYMEVSYELPTTDVAADVKGKGSSLKENAKDNALSDVAGTAHGIWKMTFHTPEPVVMTMREAQQAGYGAMTTPSRLVVRSPYNTAETYSEGVSGVPMEVFKVSAYYKTQNGLALMNAAAACPTGGVIFTEDMIIWHVPHHITPLLSNGIKILEMHMGINGQRLEKKQMAARQYALSAIDSHIIVEVPIGSPDGYYKSHAPDYQYHVAYSIEPMLEVRWQALDTQTDTRYKVLFPVTTPLMPRPPQVSDNTNPEDRVFAMSLGTFLSDVVLVNVTFATGTLSVEECNARGFNIQETMLSNGSKVFSLQVPFYDEVVLKHNPEPLVTAYFLPLTFGLLILPEQTPFPYAAELEVSLQDVGTCDLQSFYVHVEYGNQGHNFDTVIGSRVLTSELAEAYKLTENRTHFSIVVPYTDAVFEFVESLSVKARLDLLLWETTNNWKLNDFSLACDFPLTTTTCYSNGTITALAVKVESVPNLIPSQLTLNDQSCKPIQSDDHFAHFSFTVDSCGTTRTFFDNYLLYENEIALHNSRSKGFASPVEYRHRISCYYEVSSTASFGFTAKSRSNVPTAEMGTGQLMVQLRLAQDSSWQQFYEPADYPVVKVLREPLHFEVELMHSTDPQIELVLENCWATLHEDRTSVPSWDIIVDSCENLDDLYKTDFHPVSSDARIRIPSHVKRFSIKMFAFTKDDVVLQDQIFVHCDAMICDTNNHTDGVCSGQCVRQANGNKSLPQRAGLKTGHRAVNKRHLSSGLIHLLNPEIKS